MATIVGLLDKFGEDYFVALGNQKVMIESGSSALAKLETGECSVVMILEAVSYTHLDVYKRQAITDWLLSEEGQSYIVKGWMHSVLTDCPTEPYDGKPTQELMDTNIEVDWEKCYTCLLYTSRCV